MNILVTLKPENYRISKHCYGILAEIDWNKKEVLRTIKVPAASFQDNTAFMTCLLSGLAVVGHRVFVNAWNFLIEIDYNNFEIVNCVSYPEMADLHGMSTNGSHLWLSSCSVQCILCLDIQELDLQWRWGPDTPILFSHRKSTLNTIFKNKPTHFMPGEYRYIHKSNSPYHNHHLNDVRYYDNNLYITTKGWYDGTSSAIIKLNLDTMQDEFFVQPGGFQGIHDGLLINDVFIVTQSANNSVGLRGKDGTLTTIPLHPSSYFLRGLEYTGNSFLIGFSTWRNQTLPAKIIEYDTSFSSIISEMDVSFLYPKEVGTAIYAIHAIEHDINRGKDVK